jgi:hypothetical protein
VHYVLSAERKKPTPHLLQVLGLAEVQLTQLLMQFSQVFYADEAYFPAGQTGAHNFEFVESPPRIVFPRPDFVGHVRQALSVLHVAQLGWQFEHL